MAARIRTLLATYSLSVCRCSTRNARLSSHDRKFGRGDLLDALVADVRDNKPGATDRLFSLLYDEFRAQAHMLLRLGQRHTLCATELVNETWLRISGRALPVSTSAHFFNIAAQAMRQLLVDRARHRHANKRNGGEAVTLRAAADVPAEEAFDVLALDRVMGALQRVDASLAELAQLHLFAGLDMAEIAAMRGVSERTVFRDWRTARVFLLRFISESS